MKYSPIKSQNKLPIIIIDRMSEMKIICGVLVAGWLDLDATNGWIRCSDMWVRYLSGIKEFHIAIKLADANDHLFRFTAAKLQRYTTDKAVASIDITVRSVRASQESLPLKNRDDELFRFAKWKLQPENIESVTTDARLLLSKDHKKMFGKINEDLKTP